MAVQTIKTVKGRKLEKGQKVKVYFNLHKKCYSVKDMKTGLVVAHTSQVVLTGTQYKVSQKGRERVLREKRKNVHAYVIGTFDGVMTGYKTEEDIASQYLREGYYNPYKTETFIDKATGSKLEKSSITVMGRNGIYYI